MPDIIGIGTVPPFVMPPNDDESNPELVIHLRLLMAALASWNERSATSGKVGETVLV